MATIIQKAAAGNRAALTELFDANKQTVCGLSRALLKGNEAAADAAGWALESALQAIPTGEVQTEAEFSAFARKQAAEYCKKEILKQDAKAFWLPPKQDFRLLHVNESAIDQDAGSLETYLNCLPALQRFILVLRYVGAMSVSEIAVCIGVESSAVQRAFEAETENLSRIYRAAKAAGCHCIPPTTELLKTAFADAVSRETVPDTVETQVAAYIDAAAAPAEKEKRKQYRNAGIIAAAAVVCMLILGAIPYGAESTSAGEETEPTQSSTAATEAQITAVPETESTEPFAISSIDETEPEEMTACYADIAIEGYGTITVALDAEAAPITVANFVSLAQSGFYDGLTFHRIMEGFMMQGGDPNGDGTGGSGETIVGEFSANGYDNTLSHTAGAISMARSSDYDSASSQFFIVHEDSTYLDGQYAVFGYVIDGMDIVDAICTEAEPTDSNGSIAAEDQPVITSITIRTGENVTQ